MSRAGPAGAPGTPARLEKGEANEASLSSKNFVAADRVRGLRHRHAKGAERGIGALRATELARRPKAEAPVIFVN